MAIRLMAYVPHDAVVRSIEHVMQGDGQFYRPQTGCKVSRVARNFFNNVLPQFFANFRKLINAQFTQIFGIRNRI